MIISRWITFRSVNTGFRILLAEFWHQEGHSRDEEDDEDANGVDQDGLWVLLAVILVAPDCLLQVTHEGSRPCQHQDSWAEILNKEGLIIIFLKYYFFCHFIIKWVWEITNITNLMEVQHQSTEVCRELWEEEGCKPQGPLIEKISSYLVLTISDNFLPGLQRAELPRGRPSCAACTC